MFLPQPRFYFWWKRIRIRLSVQFFQPVLMSLFDELRIFQKIRSCACHDFCRRQHALMGNTCLSLSNSLPGMKCCSCRIAAHICLHRRNHPAHITDISRSFFADSSYMLSFSVLCSCVCSRLISPSVSSWHKQDNTLMHQSPGHIQRRTPYNF